MTDMWVQVGLLLSVRGQGTFGGGDHRGGLAEVEPGGGLPFDGVQP